MQPLDKILRSQLERTVKSARETAEAAARAALEQIGVGEAAPFDHLNEKERDLRRKLRIHGRQLGDLRHAKNDTQEIDRLIEEVAYEHWHRMLFARFLAENGLLMYPDPDGPVAVTLDECEELAPEEGATNGWELAARFAARMLPQIFRLDSPVFLLTLPPEHQQKLERFVADLPSEVFVASDSLGWVYQYWQAKKKDEVNASEVKIGARELPAVTQLFTEPYMVNFLLDNSLGAWWAARRLTQQDLKNAQSEEELRQKASISGVPLDFLRFVQQEDGTWTPAVGTFDAWPTKLSELKTLDPCCGSGHFLVAAFLMLVPIRMACDGLSAKQAVDAVLRENIHGLELDQRCVELAAFALALAAWNFPNAGGYRTLPELHIACSGLSISVAKEEWKQLGLHKKNLAIALEWLHDAFQDAPILGSLLDPKKEGMSEQFIRWNEVARVLEQALQQEPTEEQQEAAVVARGLAKASTLLSGRYHWIFTNVPYLARGKQSERLRDFSERRYPAAKNDLATVFLARCLQLCAEGGTSSIVLPQNWLFLTSYKKFREILLKDHTWHLIARLGPQAFQTPMWDFNVQLLTISRGSATKDLGALFRGTETHHLLRGLDVSEQRTASEKAALLRNADIQSVVQANQLQNPDARITLDYSKSIDMLAAISTGNKGITTNDDLLFIQKIWEQVSWSNKWEYFQTTTQGISFLED